MFPQLLLLAMLCCFHFQFIFKSNYSMCQDIFTFSKPSHQGYPQCVVSDDSISLSFARNVKKKISLSAFLCLNKGHHRKVDCVFHRCTSKGICICCSTPGTAPNCFGIPLKINTKQISFNAQCVANCTFWI